MTESESNQSGRCRTFRMGVLLMIVGGIAALDHFTEMSLVSHIWPTLIAILGIGFLGIYIQRGHREMGFLGVGTYLICFSLLAFYCSFTSWRNALSLWPLFIAALGVSFFVIYAIHDRRRYAILTGLVLFAIAGELIILLFYGGQFWWSALLFLGASLLITEKSHAS